jgi:hypothetical protein
MRRFVPLVLCGLLFVAFGAQGQAGGIPPIHVPSGSVLTFYLQTRLNPGTGNEIDFLPKGTVLKIKVLESIDSDLTRDGAEFKGIVVTPLESHDQVVIHADAEVRGLFALLRSRNHPDGFRYELLITGITDGGKLFQLTASLNPSFQDSTPVIAAKAEPAPAAAGAKPSEQPTQK